MTYQELLVWILEEQERVAYEFGLPRYYKYLKERDRHYLLSLSDEKAREIADNMIAYDSEINRSDDRPNPLLSCDLDPFCNRRKRPKDEESIRETLCVTCPKKEGGVCCLDYDSHWHLINDVLIDRMHVNPRYENPHVTRRNAGWRIMDRFRVMRFLCRVNEPEEESLDMEREAM